MKQQVFLSAPRLAMLLFVSLITTALSILTVGMASTSQIYIDDLDFDYSLDSLVTSADGYGGYSTAFNYNADDNQAEDVAVYVQIGTFHPSGELRIYIDSANELNSTLPVATAIVPDGSSSSADFSGGFEVITKAVTNDDVGLKLKVADMSLEDVTAKYMSKLAALEYAVTPTEAATGGSNYMVSKKYANYIFSFKQAGDAVEVAIKGM